jgi:glutathione synthase/RimK-type ligase-like ATP-grasp enzyme
MPALEVALVTARAARGLDEDEPPLHLALQAAGCNVQIAEWDDPRVDWSSFDLALLRSAWDYAERQPEFLAWVDRAAAVTCLLNPPPVVRWSTDKHYLADLRKAGVATVPSSFIEPGDDASRVLEEFLAAHAHAEFVVKPAVGAGSRDTQRHLRTALADAVAHSERILQSQRSVLLQPYLKRVDQDGETALMFFEGEFSHAIRKGPLLPPSGAATKALFAPETIVARVPGADELSLARKIMSAIPFEMPVYARIDLIRDDDGVPCLLELELAEPSLFFVHAAGSAERYTAAVLRKYASCVP